MRISWESIHPQPDGVLLLTSAGPILVRSEAVRDMVNTLAQKAASGVEDTEALPRDRLSADHHAMLTDLLDMAGLTDGACRSGPLPAASKGHVLIVGDAGWVPALAEDLALSRAASLTLWQPAAKADEGTRFDIRRVCSRTGAIISGPVTRRYGALDKIRDLTTDTLVIGAMAPARIRGQICLEQACRSAGIAFLGAEIIGTRGSVGPLSLPGTRGCWLCARQRRQARSHDPHAAARADRLSFAHYPPLPPDVARAFARAVAEDVRCFLNPGGDLTLRRHVRIVDVAGQTSTRHGFIPMPLCETCGSDRSPEKTPDLSDMLKQPSEDTIRDVFRDWIDPETGPFVGPCLRRLPHQTRVHAAVAQVAPFCPFQTDPAPPEPAAGKGLSAGQALLGALGEAFERYAASRCDPRRLVWATLARLDGQVFDPRDVGLYSPCQYARKDFPFKPFDPDIDHLWGEAVNPRTGGRAWVLASQLYYRFPPGFSDYAGQVTSSGLAAGTDFESAAMRAVLELVERDAVMVAWLRAKPGRLLPMELCDADTTRVIGDLAAFGASVRLYRIEGAGGIPVVLCAAMGDGQSWPGLSATSAAHPKLRKAIRGAVLEQAASGIGLMKMLRDNTGPRPARPEDVQPGQFLDHACYYLRQREKELAFLHDAQSLEPAPRRQAAKARNLVELVSTLGDDGIQIALADLTPDDVAGASFRVVRAVAIGLQPLACGFGMEFLGSRRLSQGNETSLNAAIHPFC